MLQENRVSYGKIGITLFVVTGVLLVLYFLFGAKNGGGTFWR